MAAPRTARLSVCIFDDTYPHCLVPLFKGASSACTTAGASMVSAPATSSPRHPLSAHRCTRAVGACVASYPCVESEAVVDGSHFCCPTARTLMSPCDGGLLDSNTPLCRPRCLCIALAPYPRRARLRGRRRGPRDGGLHGSNTQWKMGWALRGFCSTGWTTRPFRGNAAR